MCADMKGVHVSGCEPAGGKSVDTVAITAIEAQR
jgi:hypothetical protein